MVLFYKLNFCFILLESTTLIGSLHSVEISIKSILLIGFPHSNSVTQTPSPKIHHSIHSQLSNSHSWLTLQLLTPSSLYNHLLLTHSDTLTPQSSPPTHSDTLTLTPQFSFLTPQFSLWAHSDTDSTILTPDSTILTLSSLWIMLQFSWTVLSYPLALYLQCL